MLPSSPARAHRPWQCSISASSTRTADTSLTPASVKQLIKAGSAFPCASTGSRDAIVGYTSIRNFNRRLI